MTSTISYAHIRSLAELIIDGANREGEPLKVTVLTGAGVSTESGLPDFRSRDGLWNGKTDLMELLTAKGARNNPEEFTAFCRQAIDVVRGFQPNVTHRILAALQQAGLVDLILTQNVDGYHQAAGATKVVEAHGSLGRIVCETCKQASAAARFLQSDRCTCGGRLRSDIILFGEMLPQAALTTAIEALAETELLLIMGSTLVVDPIARAPLMVMANGGKAAVLNGEKTAWDEYASYTLYGRLSELSKELYSCIYELGSSRHQLRPLTEL